MLLIPLKEVTTSANVYPQAVISPAVFTQKDDSPYVPLVWIGRDLSLPRKPKKKDRKKQPNLPLLYRMPLPKVNIKL